MSEWIIVAVAFGLAFTISEYYNRRIQRIHEERIRELKAIRVHARTGGGKHAETTEKTKTVKL